MPKLCELCDETRKLKHRIPRCKNVAKHTVTGHLLGAPRKLMICDTHFRREVREAVQRGGYDRLVKLAREAQDALLWCSAAMEFAPGSPGRRGWNRGPAKVIKRLHAETDRRFW